MKSLHLSSHLFFLMDILYYHSIADLYVLFGLSLLLSIIQTHGLEHFELQLTHQLFFLVVLLTIDGLLLFDHGEIDIIENRELKFFFNFNKL
jgi:uncharacterized paraquat-inducible protein A